MSERVTDISSHLVFFTLEINRIDDATLEREMAGNESARRYSPWVRDLRVFRPHQLSMNLRPCCTIRMSPVRPLGADCSMRPSRGLQIPVAEQSLTVNAALEKLSSPDRSIRQQAGEAIGVAFNEKSGCFR